MKITNKKIKPLNRNTPIKPIKIKENSNKLTQLTAAKPFSVFLLGRLIPIPGFKKIYNHHFKSLPRLNYNYPKVC